MLESNLILCLGNEILSDDGFGAAVAKQLAAIHRLWEAADVVFAPLAGLNLLDLLANRQRVLIVDTIRTGRVAPGTLHKFEAGSFAPSHHLTTSHQIGLPSALELGKLLGLQMPQTVEVIAVEAADLETLAETMSPPVQEAVSKALVQIREWVSSQTVWEHDPREEGE